MRKDRNAYTADGEPITLHDHDWVMVTVTMLPNPDIKRPMLGATVLWRCTRRNCQGLREVQYKFTKPRINQNANRFSSNVRAIVNMTEEA
jgi:hypothetical protein